MSKQIGVRKCPHCDRVVPDANSESDETKFKYCVYCGMPDRKDEIEKISKKQRSILEAIHEISKSTDKSVSVLSITSAVPPSSKESVRTILYTLLSRGYVQRKDWGGYILAPKGEMYLNLIPL